MADGKRQPCRFKKSACQARSDLRHPVYCAAQPGTHGFHRSQNRQRKHSLPSLVFFAEKINPKISASVPSETDTICVSILIRYSPIISPSHLPNTENRSCLLIFATPSALSSMNCPTNTPYSTTEHFAEPLPPTICIFREFRRSTFH